MVRTDGEDGPLRPADPAERNFELARAAEHYPELVHLTPPRPRNATTCYRYHGRLRLMFSSEAPGCVYLPGLQQPRMDYRSGMPVNKYR